MSASRFSVAVTPPPICNSSHLRAEITQPFPESRFNDRNRYLNEAELIDFCGDAEVLLVGRDPVTEAVLEALPKLRLVSKYGVGLDNLDQEALQRRDIQFGWTPGVNRRCVAELTLAFMLGLVHNVFQSGFSLKRGDWNKEGGWMLQDKTVGIIGCGHVGMDVVRLLKPFGCRVLVRDILDKKVFCSETGSIEATFDEVVEQSDLVSLHVPLTDLTRNMMDRVVLEKMKPTSFLINTSRGGVVDEPALKDALQRNSIAGAALDVFVQEPPEDAELLVLPNLMVTPHIGGNAREAVEAMALSAISHIVKFFEMER